MGQRVKTKLGIGTILEKESPYNARGDYRVGIKYDVFPENKPRHMYKDDILYHPTYEVELIKT